VTQGSTSSRRTIESVVAPILHAKLLVLETEQRGFFYDTPAAGSPDRQLGAG
jgi:hypothetical protein